MAGAVLFVFMGAGGDELEKREVGRAMRTTPKSEISAAICSMRVKVSCMRREHAKQATMGARKVMTVASAMGR